MQDLREDNAAPWLSILWVDGETLDELEQLERAKQVEEDHEKKG